MPTPAELSPRPDGLAPVVRPEFDDDRVSCREECIQRCEGVITHPGGQDDAGLRQCRGADRHHFGSVHLL